MKLKIKNGILLIISLSLIWSCQDRNNEFLIEKGKLIETVTITEALDFLESTYFQSNTKSSNAQYASPNLDYIWQEDIINNNELLTIIRASTIHKKSSNRILLLKVNNKIKSVVFSMYPITDNVKSDFFTGSIIITDLNGNFIDGFKINNGSTIAKYLQKSKSDNTKSLKRTHSDDEEFGWIIDLEEYEVIATAPTSIIYLSFFTFEEQAPDFEDGGGDSWEYNESGGTPSLPPVVIIDTTFSNTVANCVKIKLENGNILINLLAGFNLDASSLNVTFKVENLTGTHGKCIYNLYTRRMEIIIDIDRLNASSMELANTILHESFHAYIYGRLYDSETHTGSFPEPNFEEDFRAYETKYGDSFAQHNYMADRYIMYMKQGLSDYLSDESYNLSFLNYVSDMTSWYGVDFMLESLAWSGLKGTEAWSEFYNNPSNKAKYDDTYQFIIDLLPKEDCEKTI